MPGRLWKGELRRCLACAETRAGRDDWAMPGNCARSGKWDYTSIRTQMLGTFSEDKTVHNWSDTGNGVPDVDNKSRALSGGKAEIRLVNTCTKHLDDSGERTH